MSDPEDHVDQQANYATMASNIYRFLQRDKSLRDVVLYGRERAGEQVVTADLKPIRAHKALLASQSTRFEHLFAAQPNSPSNVYIIVGVDHAALEHIVKYIYTGKLPEKSQKIEQDDVDDYELQAVMTIRQLSDGAVYFGMKKLVEMCKHRQRYHEGGQFEISIKTLTSCEYVDVVLCGPRTTVEMVKWAITNRLGIAAAEQRLIYAGKQLADCRSLRDYGIEGGSVLHLVLRLRGCVCGCAADKAEQMWRDCERLSLADTTAKSGGVDGSAFVEKADEKD